MPSIIELPASTEVVGRRWRPEPPAEPLRRTRRHCGAVVLEVTADSLSWHGIDEVLRDTMTATMGPDVSYELQTNRDAPGVPLRVLSIVIWDVGPLALTVLARRIELAIETTVAWATVDTGCAAGRDSCPEQLLTRAHRALARRRAERLRRRVSGVPQGRP